MSDDPADWPDLPEGDDEQRDGQSFGGVDAAALFAGLGQAKFLTDEAIGHLPPGLADLMSGARDAKLLESLSLAGEASALAALSASMPRLDDLGGLDESFDLYIDDSGPRAAEAAERTAEYMVSLLAAMERSVALNEQSRIHNEEALAETRKAAGFTRATAIWSIVLAGASLLVSLVLGVVGILR